MASGEELHKSYIHKPKQQRSQVRYQHLLNTAALMFAQQGYENVGTNHIAATAEVSVGSFYRFFSDKEALVEALVQHYLTELAEVLPHEFQPEQPMTEVVHAMLEKVFEFDRQNPAFAQLLMTQAGHLVQASIQMHLTLEHWVEGLLKFYHPQLPLEAIHLCAASGMGIVKGMMTMTHPPDLIPFEVVIEEMIVVLMAYVSAFVQRQAL